MIYIASPYTHDDPDIMDHRFSQVRALTIALIEDGLTPFSPIVYCHEMAKHANFPRDAVFWQKLNASMLRRCDSMMVLQLPGWKTSHGVQWEISMAMALHISTVYIAVKPNANN